MENWIAQALTRLFDCHRTATSRDCDRIRVKTCNVSLKVLPQGGFSISRFF